VFGESSYFSEASRRRSRWGSARGCPVLSSHFSPGLAPQVGHRTASVCFSVTLMAIQCAFARQQDGQFCTAHSNENSHRPNRAIREWPKSGAFQAIGCAVADGNVWTQIRSRALNKTVRTGALMEVPAEYPQGSPKAFTFEQTHVVASSPWVLPPTLLGETTVWIQERPSRASDFFPPRSHVGHHCKVAPRRAE
jgi:hypothetical protein